MKMKTPLTLAVIGFAAALVASAAELQTVASFEKTITKKVGHEYLLALPTGYEAAKDKAWPLLVFLHGSGERGRDVWKVAVHGPAKLLRESPLSPAGQALAENFIVVSPQCPPNVQWDDDAIGALLDEIAAKHRVDAKRVYLTGLSMGGYGTWSYAMKNPGRFAAIVPICGGGSTVDVRRSSRGERRAALTTLGVWVFHGAKDPTVPLAESQQMVDALKQVGVGGVQFTVYPEAKHDSWTETYAKPELYAWLLRHAR